MEPVLEALSTPTGSFVCELCGKEADKTGTHQKRCLDCRKAYEREQSRIRMQEFRARRSDAITTAAQEHGSADEVSRKYALEVLSEVGIGQHIAETVFALLEVAARHHKLPVNDFLVRNGLRATLAAINKQELPTVPEDGSVIGELSGRLELYRLYDATGCTLTFDEWLKERHDCKTDFVKLGRILGKDFHEKPHGEWRDFLPSFHPDTLPANYTQEEMKVWLAAQLSKTEGEKRDFLLLCSRNSYKSTASLVWSLTAVLCCPDIRLLLCSETTKLSKAFIKSFRAYWERGSGAQNERYHQLFPEYLIEPGNGSVLSFKSPLAHLNLPQETAEVTSLESSSTGSRFDIGLFDDIISNTNTGNEEIRESSTAKFDALQKLREVGGITLVIGTPWNPADTYSTILQRNEDDHSWAIRRDPAWVVRPEAQHKAIHDLTEADVDLLFPERLTFAFLKKELGKTKAQERFFRSQNLVEFVPDEDDSLKLNFDRDLLTKATMLLQDAPKSGDTILSCDTAFSTSKYADLSALSVLRLFTNSFSQKACCVMTQESGRFRGGELAFEILKLVKQWNPRLVIIERPPNYDSLENEIKRVAQRFDVHIPLFWIPPDNSKNAKLLRLKSLEMLLPDRLRFASGPYIDSLFNQFERLSSSEKRGRPHDDLADSISLGVKFFRLDLLAEAKGDDSMKKLQEEAFQQALMNQQYARIFGSASPMYKQPQEETPVSSNPLEQHARSVLGPGFRLWRR